MHSDVELHHPFAHDANALEVATRVQVPCAQGNAVQLRPCTAVRMSSAAPAIKWKPLAKAVSSKEKAADSVVLKCKADRRFCETDSWPKVSDKPGAAARFWASGAGVKQADVIDTWNWQLRAGEQGGRPAVQGLMRVTRSVASLLLSKSGHAHQVIASLWSPSARKPRIGFPGTSMELIGFPD